MYQITAKQLVHVAPGCNQVQNLDTLVYALNRAARAFEVSHNPRRLRYFVAQLAYESAHFTKTEEDLSYRDPARIASIFKYGFDNDRDGVVDPEEIEFAKAYTRNPIALANRAYANRMGNRDEASGDGWLYRGRGFIQLTFLANYYRASMGLYGDKRLVENPDLVSDKSTYAGAALTAGYYWRVNGLNELADADQFSKVTGKIHGAVSTVKDRLPYLRRANEVMHWGTP